MTEVETKSRPPAAAPVAPAEAGAGHVGPSTAADDGSFGRALAAAREARGLSQADIAAQLRLQVRQVNAIEEEDLAALPEGAFVRGYVRNYARLVDLPADPLLSLLGARLKPADPLHADGGTAAVSPIQRTPRAPFSGRIVIGGVLVVLAVLAAFGWWSMRATEQATARAPVDPAPAASAAPESPPPVAAAEPPRESPAVEGAASPDAAPPATASGEAALRLTFRGPSWVEIRQADGKVLMSKSNAAGTVQAVEGVPPYLLVIGNASKVDLEYRGQPVDLASLASRADVARVRLD